MIMNIGFYDFIIADIALLVYLKERGIKCSIHLSGECAELNSLSIDFFNKFHISRYIFHRKNTIDDMKKCIENNKIKNLEYEAFILNERCHFTGAFCSSLHCDELMHLCKVPYEIGKVNKDSCHFKDVDKMLAGVYDDNEYIEDEEEDEDEYKIGSTGCGLCALRKLKEGGVTHLKVVGRGNYIDIMEKDIQNLRRAIDIMERSHDEIEFKQVMKDRIFNNKCSNECYYLK